VEFKVKTSEMFKKKKNPAIPAVTEIATVNEIESNVRKVKKKKRQREKCENCKQCWGFCDFLKTSWKLFKEFSGDTSIHGKFFTSGCTLINSITFSPTGIKYLTDKKLHWSEKLFWAIALTISIIACSLLIIDSFRKWQAAPVIVSFSEKFMNIWELPFAAITICPIAGTTPLNENYNSTNIPRHSKVTALKNFTGSVEKRITNTKWRNDNINSSDLFTEVVTQEGFCWTFNMMRFDDLFENDV
jgi:Pyruvate/2-oxoacid:ferredoxin oxidoreductase delta subunit